MTSGSSFNPFEMAQDQFDRTVDLMGVEQPIRDLPGYPIHEQSFADPVRMDGSKAYSCRGFRVQRNDARGPSGGGVVCDPRMMSAAEQERTCRACVRRVARNIGARRAVPAPDVAESELADPGAVVALTNGLGNGTRDGIRDIIYVKPDHFDTAETEHVKHVRSEHDLVIRVDVSARRGVAQRHE